MNIIKTEYLVIGAGSGGLTAAVGLKKLDKDVVLVSENIGGDCTHYGCVPSKAFIYSANQFSEQKIKKSQILNFVREKIVGVIQEEEDLINKHKIKYIKGLARFKERRAVEIIGTGTTIEFKKAIISTGSSPKKVNDIFTEAYSEKVINNEDLFYLDDLPESILIIGAGPVGTEIASAMAIADVEVTLITKGRILSYLTRESSELIKNSLEKSGVTIYENIKSYDYNGSKLMAVTDDNIKLEYVCEFGKVLHSIGRVPNTDNLSLENAGIEYSTRGIKVNSSYKTSNNSVYAIGDVIPGMKFTHLADMQARVMLTNFITRVNIAKVKTIPASVYTNPSVSSIGRMIYNQYNEIFTVDLSKSDRAYIQNERNLNVSISVNMITARINGVEIVGKFGEELINMFTLMMNKNIPLFALIYFMYPYPTYASSLTKFPIEFLKTYVTNLPKRLLMLVIHNIPRILVGIFWLVIAVVVLRTWQQYQDDLPELIKLIYGWLNSGYGVLLYILLYSIRGFASLPATILTVIAGASFGLVNGIIFSVIASNISAVVSYLLGMSVFYKNNNADIDKDGQGKLVSYLNNSPFEAVMVARLAFIPFDVVSYLSGALRLNLFKFFLGTALGALPGTVAVVAFGASLNDSVQDIEKLSDIRPDPVYIYISLCIVIITLLISVLLKKVRIS